MDKTKFLAASLLCTALLTGCSKEPAATEQKVAGSTPAPGTPAPVAQAPKAAAVVPVAKADRSKPLAEYQDLKSGRTVMFAYLSVDTLPIDYRKIAALVSSEYASSQDEFRKHDLMAALKPGIDAEIAKARANRYYRMEGEVEVEKYDFVSKSFQLGTFKDSDTQMYFNDIQNYSVGFANAEQFQRLKVEDEAQARRVEAVRAETAVGGNPLQKAYAKHKLFLSIYLFASEAKLGQPVLIAEIVRVQLKDEKGNVLAEM